MNNLPKSFVVTIIALVVSQFHCFAQTPTKQETIDWIKGKMHQYPGSWWWETKYGDTDSLTTKLNGDSVTNIFVAYNKKGEKMVEKETYCLNTIYFTSIGKDPNGGFISFELNKKLSVFCYATYNDRKPMQFTQLQAKMVLYWQGDDDLKNRMIKALQSLSDFNKPKEAF